MDRVLLRFRPRPPPLSISGSGEMGKRYGCCPRESLRFRNVGYTACSASLCYPNKSASAALSMVPRLMWRTDSLLISANASASGCVRPATTSSSPCRIPKTASCRSSRSQRSAWTRTSSRVAYRPVANSCSTKGSSSGGSSICMSSAPDRDDSQYTTTWGRWYMCAGRICRALIASAPQA